MNGLRSAIGFLTILPVAPSHVNGSMASARGWFPVVGLLLGILLVVSELLLFLLFGQPQTGRMEYAELQTVAYSQYSLSRLLWPALIVVALAVLTRALHLDGFMDTCDALLGGFDRERRLAILRDPHVGAFAVVGVVCLLLIKVVAIAGLPPAGWPTIVSSRLPILLLFPCLSRWAMLLTMELYPYVRESGLGTAFFDGGGRKRVRWQLTLGFLFTLVVSVALAGVAGIVLLAAVCAVAWGIGAWSSRLLGGVTGDIYGAVNEISEVVVILLALIIVAASPVALHSPLLEMLWSGLP